MGVLHKSMTRPLLLTAFVAVGAACSNNPGYPSDWPARVETGGECPDISGSYFSDPVGWAKDYEGGDPGYTYSLLYSLLTLGSAGPGCIDIRQPDSESLIANLSPASSARSTVTLERGKDFRCRDGKLWIKGPSEFDVHELYGVFVGTERFGLAKADDGSLIGEGFAAGRGTVILVVPYSATVTEYFRWRACDEKLIQ